MASEAIAEGVLFLGGMVLNIFVIPTLLDESAAVPRLQSIPSAIALVGMAGAYSTLGLVFPMIASLFGGGLWVLVAVFRATE